MHLVGERQVAVRIVEERGQDDPVAVVGDQLVDHEVGGCNAGAGGDRGNRVVGRRFVVDVAVLDCPELVEPVEHEHRVQLAALGRRRGEPCAQLRVGERRGTLGERESRDRCIRRMEREGVEAALEAHQEPDDPTGDLGDDRQTFGVGLVEQREHLAPQIGRVVGLIEVDADGAAGAAGEFLHPGPLVARDECVVGGELEHAVAGTSESVGDAEQLVAGGVCPRHELARLRLVDRGARRWRSRALRRAARVRRCRPSRRCRRRWRPRSLRHGRPSRSRAPARGRPGRRCR